MCATEVELSAQAHPRKLVQSLFATVGMYCTMYLTRLHGGIWDNDCMEIVRLDYSLASTSAGKKHRLTRPEQRDMLPQDTYGPANV